MHLNPLAVSAIAATAEKERERRLQKDLAAPKAVDLKMRELVSLLPRVKEGSLLATGVDPSRQILHSGKKGRPVEWQERKKGREARTHSTVFSPFPIGLKRCDPYPWINALMQFLLFLPACREILSYIPKSLQGVKDFADRYLADAEAKRPLSSAEGQYAGESLLNKFPKLYREDNRIANLDEIVQLLWSSASLRSERPAWQLLWDSKRGIESLLAEEKAASAFEWLVGVKQLYECDPMLFQGQCLQRHYLLRQSSSYMEMDAFIEARPDEGKKISYFAYLKIGGSWVQCADDKVSRLKCSRSLEIPLQRGILFHFKRIPMR